MFRRCYALLCGSADVARVDVRSDWSPDCEHTGIRGGRVGAGGAGGRTRRTLHWRGGGGARVSEPGGTDGGEVYSESIWRVRIAAVPDGGSGALACGWEPGVFGTAG